MVRGAGLARWPGLHPLRRDWRRPSRDVRQEAPGRCFQCNACRKQFTVADRHCHGTKPYRAAYLAQSDVSAFRFQKADEEAPTSSHAWRQSTLKSTWFLMMRIREAMREQSVQANESFIGKDHDASLR